MGERGARVLIDRAPQAVFRYLVELNDAEWRSGGQAMRLLSESPDGIGARHVEVRRVPGRTIETTAEVVEYEPDKCWTVRRSTGPIRPQVRYDLRAQGTGTELTLTFDVPMLAGAAKLLRPVVGLVGRFIERAAAKDLRRLKHVLETVRP